MDLKKYSHFRNHFSSAVKLLALLAAVLPGQAFSQTANFTYYGIENGLPHSGIQTMVQDRDGNMWFGTMAGVSKYNGITFQPFTKTHGLAENWVTSSCIDKKGNLWFGHWAGGISYYDSAADTFYEVTPKNIPLFKTIYVIYEDRAGTVWFGTEGAGLLKYTPGKNKQINPEGFTLIDKNEGLSGNNIYSIVQDKKGILWFATDSGITKYNSQESILKEAFDYLTTEDGLPSNNTTALLEYVDGTIWIGTRDSGVVKFVPGVSSAISAENFKTYPVREGLTHNHVRVLFEDAEHNIWIGTFGGGVSKYNPYMDRADVKEKTIFKTLSTFEGLSNNKVLSIVKDREDNIWIGTYIGLNQYRDEHFEIYGKQEGFASSLIWSIIQDHNGNFWLGSEGGLIRYMPAFSNKEKAIVNFTKTNGLGNNNVNSVFEDAEGNIWGSTWGEGVFKMDPASGKVTRYTTKEGLPSNDIYSICSDKEGNIWFGSDKGGAARFNHRTSTFETFTSSQGLGNNRIYSIFRDSKDNLWFATLGGGLTRYDGMNFKTFSEREGLAHKFVLCITEDRDGHIWIGTYSGGLYKFDGKLFTNYSIHSGLTSDTPYLLICDNDNDIWIGTNQGIDKYDQSEKMFLHYGKQEGFLGVETNPNAACKDINGSMWFGTIIGAVKYNAKKDKKNMVEPITFVSAPQIFFHDTPIPADHILKYDQGHLTFSFIGISLTNPKKVKYKFMLEGLDKDWSPETYNTSFTYPNLRPGKYTFKIIACNNDGVWNKKPATWSFEITPPFWQRPWFYITATIAFIGLIYLIIMMRIRNLNRAKHILEEQVALKTRQLREEKEKVEKSNLELEKLSIVARETHNGVVITDPDGNMEYINAGFTRLTGFTLDEIRKSKGSNLRQVSANPRIMDYVKEGIRDRKSLTYETINITKEGKEIWVSSALTPIFDESGQIKKVIFVDTDITERKKTEEVIQEKNGQLEQKNKDITDSINYASRIQQAILPQRELINKMFPSSFIFYKPKDIVSGDFYWYGQKDDRVIVAAVDCTGHGVPGAFMSIIGYTLLNEIINERGITEPALALDNLHKQVLTALHQTALQDVETKDGMDIALCSIDLKKMELQFAGAYRPLLIVNGQELREIKGDKFPIGGQQSDDNRSFSNNKLKIKKGETIYLFSDGFVDQFGGPEGKKFMVKNFKDLLLSIQDLDMKKQEERLRNHFEKWQGKMDQVDDVMVIGIRI